MNTIAEKCCDRMDQLEAGHQALRNQVISFIADLTVIGGGRVEFKKPVVMEEEGENARGTKLIFAGESGIPHLLVRKPYSSGAHFIVVLPLLRTATLLDLAREAVCSVLNQPYTTEELMEKMEKISWISLTK